MLEARASATCGLLHPAVLIATRAARTIGLQVRLPCGPLAFEGVLIVCRLPAISFLSGRNATLHAA